MAVWTLAAALGCGGSSSHPDAGGDGDFTLAVAPEELAIARGQSTAATITIERTGAVGEVELAAVGLPPGVSAAFDVNPVPAAVASVELTISVAASAEPGSSELTISGTAGDLERTAALAFTAQNMTVSGRLRYEREGITVVLVGKTPQLTGPGGTFTFTDVVPPYDLYTVAQTSSDHPGVIYYRGLTRPDPVVEAVSPPVGLPHETATVTGEVTGGGSLENPIALIWSEAAGETSAVGEDGTYSMTVSWRGGASASGTVYGLQWTTGASGAPESYTGYGEAALTVTAGGTHQAPIALSPPETAQLTGTITPPEGLPDPVLTLSHQFGSNSHELWTATTTSAEATIPRVPSGGSVLHAHSGGGELGSSSFVRPGLTGDTDVSVDMVPPPVPLQPPDEARGVDVTTPFAVEAAGPAVCTFRILSERVDYIVVTAGSEVTIPDVPERPLPPREPFTWTVECTGPLETTDEVTGPDPAWVVPGTASGPMRYRIQRYGGRFLSDIPPPPEP